MDERYMRMAIDLALKAKGRTSPNPLVGCVIVNSSQIVGMGYHQKAGTPHAEAWALKEAGNRARGSTLYVNLEPCCHYGRTPPCTKAIIESGVAQVVAGMIDPDRRVSGKGLQELQQAGIQTLLGVLQKEAEAINEAYMKYITTGLPFVTIKVAASLDGKIATRSGESRWITGEAARRFVHHLRDEHDAILVGIGTLLKDDPQLTTRLEGERGKDPIRVIVDSTLRIPLWSRALTADSDAGTIVATTLKAPQERIREIEARGAKVIVVKDVEGMVDLKSLFVELGKLQISTLLIEGGARINASALKEGLVDKLFFFIAPKIIGGEEAPGVIGGRGIERLDEATTLERLKVTFFDGDILIEGYISKRS